MTAKKKDLKSGASSVMDKFFSDAQDGSQTASEKKGEEMDTQKVKTPQRASRKSQKVSFSFRADSEEVKGWRVYAKVKGLKVDDLGEKALEEYIKRHKLTEAEKTVYEARLS